MNDERQHNRNERPEPLSGELHVELLSAYLDDPAGLSDEERRQVEARLESDPEARRAMAELSLIASELRDLPAMAAPRSYHLDAGMVGAPEPLVLQQTTAWYARHSGAVRWATAAAAVIFVFVLSADLVLNGVFSDDSGSMDAALPVSESRLNDQQPSDDDESGAGAGAVEDTGGGDDAAAPLEATEAEAAEDGAAEAEEEAQEPSTLEVAPAATAETDATADAQDRVAGAPTEAESSPPAITQGAGEAESGADSDTTMFAIDQTTSANLAEDDGGSDRRPWRIAEFGLIVILGLLITAMVVLPRLAGTSARRRNG